VKELANTKPVLPASYAQELANLTTLDNWRLRDL